MAIAHDTELSDDEEAALLGRRWDGTPFFGATWRRSRRCFVMGDILRRTPFSIESLHDKRYGQPASIIHRPVTSTLMQRNEMYAAKSFKCPVRITTVLTHEELKPGEHNI